MSEYRNYDDEWLLHSDNYIKHVSAMTSEKLHSKSDIAAELAYRDDRITELEERNSHLEAQLKERNDSISRLVCDLDDLQENSVGVIGLHMNGDIASWSSLREGGQFEGWLMSFDQIPQPPKEQGHE